MSIFKCKMCGGNLEIEEGMTVCECEYCGTKQTVPRLDSDRKANLYDRANHFRRNNDYDKAIGIYEQILNEDNTDAETYWSLVLCRYGIEYVEDPQSHKRIPTVNRAQFTSIYMDEDYKSALQYADTYQKSIYEEEAKVIDDIQRGILEISSKEEPFDVFICYKETDANGRRTQDSVLANDLYHQLTQEGFKVFFSRITLEDKLGTAYEPYIFAALNSAKVMVVLGTRPEYFNSVWVKNEWSRYLALVKNSGGKKTLIPAYRDMDPYDLPEEFSHLQAQDMSKLGFMQDLIRGIKKISQVDEPKPLVKETVVVNSAVANIAPLLKRAFMYLEDGEWQNADEYAEKVLDQDPENAEAYIAKLMVELKVHNREDLSECDQLFVENNNYKRALRFGDKTIIEEFEKYVGSINARKETERLAQEARKETERLNQVYNLAIATMKTAYSESAFKSAAELFTSVSGFKDADSLAAQCSEKVADTQYNKAVTAMKQKDFKHAADLFKKLSGYKDADILAEQCIEKSAEEQYNYAVTAMKASLSENAFQTVAELFKDLSGYKDAEILAEQCLEKAEECRKKKEEEKRDAERKSQVVAQTLKEGWRTKNGPTLEQNFSAAIERFKSLEHILNVFGSTQTQIQTLQNQYNELIIQEKQLSDQRKSLGIFAGKEKKRIDDELATIVTKKSDITNRIDQKQNAIGHYDSVADIERDLAYARENKAVLETQIKSLRANVSNEYSFDEAMYIYLNDPSLAATVNNIFPGAKFIQVLQGKENTFLYGKYVQKTDGQPEPIEWQVLAREKDRLLAISKYALDSIKYNKSNESVTWETCSIRQFLNREFYDSAFNSEEKNHILSVNVKADKNPKISQTSENIASDKVFLLSIKELKKHFSSDSERACTGTEFLISSLGHNGNCCWWLRASDDSSDHAPYVDINGSICNNGVYLRDKLFLGFAVRPAIWIDISSFGLSQ